MTTATPQGRDRATTMVARLLLIGLASALALTVLDELVLPFPGAPLTLHYKKIWRVLPLLWLASLLLPAVRATLAPPRFSSDLPLALFVVVAALAIVTGGGHWGDFRNLVAAVGIGLMSRTLFATAERRRLFVHLIGGTVLMILARELWFHPHLLPPHETGRYDLVTANPNVLGFLFAMLLPILLAETLATTGSARALSVLYALATLIGTLLTFSRVAGLGAAAGTAVVVMASLPPRRALMLFGVTALAFLTVQRPDQWTSLRTEGDTKRVRILTTSGTLAIDAPLLGVGFGINNLERVFPERYARLYGERLFRFHSMNQVLDVLVGTGLVGTMCFLWWAGRVGARAVEWLRASPWGRDRARAAGGLAACVAIAVMSMGESPLYHGKLVPILFWLLAVVELGPSPDRNGAAPRSLSARGVRQRRRRRGRRGRRRKPSAVPR